MSEADKIKQQIRDKTNLLSSYQRKNGCGCNKQNIINRINTLQKEIKELYYKLENIK